MPPRLGPAPMTSAERQARRREQHRVMRAALEQIAQAATIRDARRIAAAALDASQDARVKRESEGET